MTDRAGNAFELIYNGISRNWLVEIFVRRLTSIVSLISRYFVCSLNQFGISSSRASGERSLKFRLVYWQWEDLYCLGNEGKSNWTSREIFFRFEKKSRVSGLLFILASHKLLHKSFFVNQNSVILFLCFYFDSFLWSFPPFSILSYPWIRYTVSRENFQTNWRFLLNWIERWGVCS